MILGDSRNYMPPILAPSSAKRIATQVLVTAKINGRKYFILRVFVCDWWCHSSQQGITYSKLATRIRYESCSILRMSMLTIFLPLRRRSSVVIVNCKHISNFVLVVDFEQTEVCLVRIEKTNIFEDKIGHIMR